MLIREKGLCGVLFLTAGLLASCEFGGGERILLSGSFHSVAHKGTGSAVIAELPHGRRILRLIQAKTYPANDLEVCMIAAPDAEDTETVRQAGFRCLGSFGRTDFDVPPDLDLNVYRAVAIWSRSYALNFTTAPLAK